MIQMCALIEHIASELAEAVPREDIVLGELLRLHRVVRDAVAVYTIKGVTPHSTPAT